MVMARDPLSRDQIVAAAIGLLDAEGIDGLSMRRLGQRLGSAATSAYWHVQSKENLLRLAADAVWDEIALPDPVQLGWREAARRLVLGVYEAAVRHRWLMASTVSHYGYGPGRARWQDRCYEVLELAGFAGHDLDAAMATLSMFVIGAVTAQAAEAAMVARSSAGSDAEQQLRDRIAEARQVAEQFPRLRDRLADQDAAGPQAGMLTASIEFGLEAILDGLAARLRDRQAAG